MILATYQYGIFAIIGGQFINCIFFTLINGFFIRKYCDYPYKEQILDILPILIAAMIMYFTGKSLEPLLVNIHPIIRLIYQILLSIIFYLFYCSIFRISAMKYAVKIINNKTNFTFPLFLKKWFSI